ncbi:MAG: F0F1 ATP synthase subunit B [Bacteroidales bacterium]|nr:F0F1 ATP synthase subunit B [Bacteroidales bacterium]MCF8332753.1 F0F1 ATP synthase subunit B [Bacteroidales bacterium]
MELVNPGIGLIFWMIVIFGLLLLVLGKYAWKPIMKSLHEREQSIDKALKSADKAREEMKNLQADNEKLRQEAREERDKILKQARDKQNEIIEQAREEANQERQKILDSAKKEISNEKQAAARELRETVADISLKVAEKIIRQELEDEKKQQKLVEKYFDEVDFR